ncbi:Glycerophosphoryl diester phosphodiesterase family-domain-containing protein [Durotheca rogersii]|uniref:Glycerophosphoryl diester phosphodiesterase family-domain-containing protein n=1 Tax=Durotheca rogersii TaxID=419775 RepID=UPI00222104DD|nr:Glycerophosphoryl diester phosphodiesterase family-domain-containing protein [Durotheca rogersii]KAI5860330.1 Glycerophosphoryl diester phosphodiesterase family-domain-containing protein [Durotheca rogersii]
MVVKNGASAVFLRKPTAADIFTACYTTILGAATIIDTQRKNERRRELDDRLKKARAASANLAAQESLGSHEPKDYLHADVPGDERPRKLWPRRKEARPHGALFQELGPMSEITRWRPRRTSWLQTQLEWVETEAAIAAEERDPDIVLREPDSDSKLQRTTTTIVNLVNRLLWQSWAGESSRSQDRAEARWESNGREDAILRELREQLQTSHYPSYKHPARDPDNAAMTRFLLGESIRRIFNQASSSKEVVGKICYNLLTSSAPPTMHTYNMLIAGFNRIERHDLAQTVIDSYLRSTAWPATQQTIICMLNHYRAVNRKKGMRDVIKRMRGVRGTGLHFLIIDKRAVYSRQWLLWATENCASRKYAFVRRAPRSDEVFNTIIKGWLHYGDVGNACMVFVACLRNGFSIAAQTLQELLLTCLAVVDYAAARKLVRGFAKHTDKFKALVDGIVSQESISTCRQVLMCLYYLLDICWFPIRGIFSPFVKVFERSLQKLKFLVHRARFEVEILDTDGLYTTTLKNLNSSNLLISPLNATIATMDLARRSRQTAIETFVGFSRLAMLLSIDRRYSDLEARIRPMIAQARAIIINIKTGYDLDPSSVLGSARPEKATQQRRYDSLCNALQVIRLQAGPMTQEGIRQQLLEYLPDPALARQFESSGNVENITIRALVSFYVSDPPFPDEPMGRDFCETIRRLEQELTDAENMTRAILFAYLRGDIQRQLRFLCPYWYQTPLEKLVKHHLRLRFPKTPPAGGGSQPGTFGLHRGEIPAASTAEEPPAEGADDATDNVGDCTAESSRGQDLFRAIAEPCLSGLYPPQNKGGLFSFQTLGGEANPSRWQNRMRRYSAGSVMDSLALWRLEERDLWSSLPRNQVPEWASSYINYKSLKKLVKAATVALRAGETVDLAEFFFALDRNLEDVDAFYNKKFAEVHRRVKLLEDRYGRSPDVVADLDDHESEELMGALLELRNQLRNLQWFGEINRRGFVKITKKLDKKIPGSVTQQRYIATKVDPKPFAKDATTARLIAEINKWLSVLGDAQNFDDAVSEKSSRSVRSLGRVAAKAMSSVPQAILDKLDAAIRNDDAAALRGSLTDENLVTREQASQDMLLNFLQRSISSRSRICIAYLLEQINVLDEPSDLNERNCIHRLVIHIGRSKSSLAGDLEPNAVSLPISSHYTNHYIAPNEANGSTSLQPASNDTSGSALLSKDDEAVKILCYLLDNLRPGQRSALAAADSLGRIPLHYAAQFGFVVLCQVIMAKMQEWGQFDVENGIDAPEWQDKEGNAPLHLAVIGGHPLTTKCLLQGENWQGSTHKEGARRKPISKSSAVLALATKANFVSIVRMLVEADVDVNWQDATGETALHIAARFGHVECASILLEGSAGRTTNLELTEKSFAWTPLHISAVDGHLPVAKLLVEAGADVGRPDSFGWTSKEHAALRGHLEIAKLLALHAATSSPSSDSMEATQPSSLASSSPPETSSLEDRRSDGSTRIPEPIKSFGHRYLKDSCLIMVSLGSMDMRKNVEAVKLERVPLAEAHINQLDTALSLVVSARGAQGEPTIIDLPVHESISTEPILFTASDISHVRLLFDIVPTYSGSEKNKIGRAVALLSSVRPSLGTKRMSLQGDVCVPIMGANLEVIGAVNFNFLIITPFSHPNMEVNSQQTYWKKLSSTMVFGHRGLGKNSLQNKSLQLGENTISSFIAAANLGAHYVEFDVQLTKDHVPVIYHDFLVSETGIDAPVHTLTLEQFLHINKESKSGSGKGSPEKKGNDANGNGVREPGTRQRSLSMDLAKGAKDSLDERMKYTLNFKERGYKANTRGNFVQAPFATLEELFQKVPQHVGFNIEMKYPMLFESELEDMDTYAIELNSFCDTVLTKVYDLAGSRHIIFSSFNPDICLCLNFKQPSIPILFLTDSGIGVASDIRASSLQEAIRFASRWNLLGIVSNAEPFVNSPRLVKVVKQTGLVCVSYGTQNNDSTLVKRQVKEGIDAVIVDNVLAIRRELTEE